LRRGATQLSGLYIGAIQWFSPIHSPDTTTTAIGAERWAAIDPSSLLLILSIQHIAYCWKFNNTREYREEGEREEIRRKMVTRGGIRGGAMEMEDRMATLPRVRGDIDDDGKPRRTGKYN
jgi:hypothetical protein